MIVDLMNAMREFHEKMGLPGPQDMQTHKLPHALLHNAVSAMRAGARMAEQHTELQAEGLVDPDLRFVRIALTLEETAEKIEALMNGNKIELLDALADCQYIHAGTAYMFNLPLPSALVEVHASNMTKKPKTGPRLRDKGQNYRPPNLASLLSQGLCYNE